MIRPQCKFDWVFFDQSIAPTAQSGVAVCIVATDPMPLQGIATSLRIKMIRPQCKFVRVFLTDQSFAPTAQYVTSIMHVFYRPFAPTGHCHEFDVQKEKIRSGKLIKEFNFNLSGRVLATCPVGAKGR